MVKAEAMAFLLCFFTLFFSFSQAKSIVPEPQLNGSFEIQTTQKMSSSCSYRVVIKTSCSSTSYTRDRVSLAFGDVYGNEAYAPRLDDPSSRTFERCSTDTFQISGSCMYQTCYLYLLRTGSDGWKPEYVKINSPNYAAVSFKFNTWIPNGVWYGFNLCNSASMVSAA